MKAAHSLLLVLLTLLTAGFLCFYAINHSIVGGDIGLLVGTLTLSCGFFECCGEYNDSIIGKSTACSTIDTSCAVTIGHYAIPALSNSSCNSFNVVRAFTILGIIAALGSIAFLLFASFCSQRCLGKFSLLICCGLVVFACASTFVAFFVAYDLFNKDFQFMYGYYTLIGGLFSSFFASILNGYMVYLQHSRKATYSPL